MRLTLMTLRYMTVRFMYLYMYIHVYVSTTEGHYLSKTDMENKHFRLFLPRYVNQTVRVQIQIDVRKLLLRLCAKSRL